MSTDHEANVTSFMNFKKYIIKLKIGDTFGFIKGKKHFTIRRDQ